MEVVGLLDVVVGGDAVVTDEIVVVVVDERQLLQLQPLHVEIVDKATRLRSWVVMPLDLVDWMLESIVHLSVVGVAIDSLKKFIHFFYLLN